MEVSKETRGGARPGAGRKPGSRPVPDPRVRAFEDVLGNVNTLIHECELIRTRIHLALVKPTWDVPRGELVELTARRWPKENGALGVNPKSAA